MYLLVISLASNSGKHANSADTGEFEMHHHPFHRHDCGPWSSGSERARLWWAAQGRRGPFGPPGAGARPPSWGDWFGSPPPRADRGGVRYLVLDALSERPRH